MFWKRKEARRERERHATAAAQKTENLLNLIELQTALAHAQITK